MNNSSQNLIANVVVQRELNPSVQLPVEYEGLSGLPFYYDFRIGILFIILGIIVFIIQSLFFGSLIFLPFLFKEYICTNCKRTFRRIKAPKYCPHCKGEVLPKNDYLRTINSFNNQP